MEQKVFIRTVQREEKCRIDGEKRDIVMKRIIAAISLVVIVILQCMDIQNVKVYAKPYNQESNYVGKIWIFPSKN